MEIPPDVSIWKALNKNPDNAETASANRQMFIVYKNVGSINRTFKLMLFLSPMKSVSHCKERYARGLVQLHGPYFDEVARILSGMTAMEYLIVRGKSSSRLCRKQLVFPFS